MGLETAEPEEEESEEPGTAFKSGFDGFVGKPASTEDAAKAGLLTGGVGAAED